MKIMIDCDGVLADFILGFTIIAHKYQSDFKPITTFQQTAWDFTDTNLTRETYDKTWQSINDSVSFWETLTPLANWHIFDWINKLNLRHDIVFVTSRSGKNPTQQTHRWLFNQGIIAPNVIVSSEKGLIARAIGVDYAIDDRPENVIDIWRANHKVKVYIQDRHYNRNIDTEVRNIVRVNSISEFLRDIEISERRSE